MSQQQNKTVVVVGDQASGKSAIVHRLIDEKFNFGAYKPTIDDCYNVVWKLPDGQYLQIQMIDTAAWNEFPTMQSLYIKMSHLVIVVFDVSSPTWRETLLTIINGVRKTKDDADIFIVGNKCDLLTRGDSCTPQLLAEVIGHSCVGHVFTSALTQQGIVGMKQLILCSRSQLTEGHYTEFPHLPKRKKLKKRLNGLALLLNAHRKGKESSVEKEQAKPKYREPVVYPEQPHYIQYQDLTRGNFDKLFDMASNQAEDTVPQMRHNKTRVSKSDAVNVPRELKGRRRSAIDPTSDYSSPGTSPNDDNPNQNLAPYSQRHRKSLDFSMMDMGDARRLLARQISRSHGDMFDKPALDITSSASTVMSDSSNDSGSTSTSSPRFQRVTRILARQSDSTDSNDSSLRRHRRLNRSSGLGVSSSLDDDDSIRSVGRPIQSTDGGRGHHRSGSTTTAQDLLSLRLSDVSLEPESVVEMRQKSGSVGSRRNYRSDGLMYASADINRNKIMISINH